MFQCQFLKALIVPKRIEHRIEPEQRRSEWHACSQCALGVPEQLSAALRGNDALSCRIVRAG